MVGGYNCQSAFSSEQAMLAALVGGSRTTTCIGMFRDVQGALELHKAAGVGEAAAKRQYMTGAIHVSGADPMCHVEFWRVPNLMPLNNIIQAMPKKVSRSKPTSEAVRISRKLR